MDVSTVGFDKPDKGSVMKAKLEGWREVKLGDIVQLSKKPWRTNDEELPYIGLEHIDENKLRLNSVGSSNSVASNKYRFNAGNTLFGKLRPYFRKVVKLDFGGICSTDIWVVVPKGETNKDFLFYFFANQELVDISYSSSSGTRMPRADWTFLSETVWALPPLPEQKAIAEVLSSLDDKIDLLHRQNKTLENIAQTLFRQWFVEYADEGWDVKKLEDIANISSGKGLKNSEYVQNGSYAIMGANGEIGRTDKYLFDEKLIFTGRVGTHGKVFISNGKVWISDNTLIIKPKNNLFYFIYFLLKNSRLERLNVGSTQPLIRQSDLKNIELLLPDQEMLFIFENQTNDVFSKIEYNRSRIRTLENLRDTLLPKLMSGTVKVKH